MPRIAAIEHPFGRPFGEVGDFNKQREVLESVFDVFSKAKNRGHIEHLPFKWHLEPKDTKWHPLTPAPIIEFMKQEGRL